MPLRSHAASIAPIGTSQISAEPKGEDNVGAIFTQKRRAYAGFDSPTTADTPVRCQFDQHVIKTTEPAALDINTGREIEPRPKIEVNVSAATARRTRSSATAPG